ncbi:MAG: cupin domain-containing protein [Betaproteobacteria bacterium]
MNATAIHHRWADRPEETLTAAIRRRFISGDRVTVAQFHLSRGGVVPRHAHENEQISLVMSGRLRFDLDGRSVEVGGGEALQIPGGLPHEVEVLEDAFVIDVFSPVRQDWIDRTDTYFSAASSRR